LAGESRRKRLRALLALAGVPKAGLLPFEAAFVHQSAVKEGLAERSNERLEFLGDAVLGFVVARSLVERYPDADEGELALRKSSLVSDEALAATAERLGFAELVVLGAALAKLPPARRRSALADAFEAFLAVLALECGMEAAAAFVGARHVAEREKLQPAVADPKTVLQEWAHRRSGRGPEYATRHEGPDHERTFFARVSVPGEVDAEGSGSSKKIAERAAAARALEVLGERYDDVTPRPLSRPRAAAGAAPPKRQVRQPKARPASNGRRS